MRSGIFESAFQKPVNQQRCIADQEVCPDSVFFTMKYRPCVEIGFHDPEAVFDLISLVCNSKDVPDPVLFQVGCYCIKTIIFLFFFDLCFVQLISYIGLFAIFCFYISLEKPSYIVWPLF